MHRAQTHDERVHVYRIETDNGFVGWGDSTGVPSDVDSLVGQNPAAIMLRDSIGFGLNCRLDRVGKVNNVPVHALLGQQVRQRCSVSWWDIDMPAADWAAEAKESLKRGYNSPSR